MKCTSTTCGILLICVVLFFGKTSNAQSADDYQTRASGNWSATTTWERFDGLAWQNVTGIAPNTIPTSGDGNITIRNGYTVTVSSTLTIDQVTVNSGGKIIVAATTTADQLTVNSGGEIDINSGKTLIIANGAGSPDMTINGTLANLGNITTTGTLSFGANSIYDHQKNGGALPTATWNATSTCMISGTTSSVPSALGQSFGNFTWNSTGQNANKNLNAALTTINGDFTVANTGGYELALSNADATINIGGDFILSGGDLTFTSTSNKTVTVNVTGDFLQSGGSLDLSDASNIGAMTLNVTGNFSQSAGSFDFGSGNANAARIPALNLTGNFSQTGSGSMTLTSVDNLVTNGTITFNKNGTQTFSIATQSNLTYTNFVVNANSTLRLNSNLTLSSYNDPAWGGKFTVNSGGTLDAGTYQLLSSSGASTGLYNAFILNAGGAVVASNSNGLISGTNGTISTSLATRTFSSAANYTFGGSTPQNSGTFTTTPTANQVNNLTINNTGGGTGVTLQQSLSVAGTCYFTAGLITTTSTFLLTFNNGATASGANNNTTNPSFVNGPVKKIGNQAFTFPVGKINVGYMNCSISAPTLATDAFTAEYKRNSGSALGSITASGLYRVSNCEYWQLDRTTGTSSVNVTLSWSGLSQCNAASYVTSLASLTVAHFNGTSWNAAGNNGGTTGNGAAGTVTWNAVSSFSPFTIGSTSSIANPLPIKFSSIKAYNASNGNLVEWTNLTEENLQQYEVERSENGTSFNSIFTITPKSNNGGKENYTITDTHILNGTNFYRIKAVQTDGSVIYSAIVKVDPSTGGASSVTIYPNPVISEQFTLELNNYKRGNYSLKLISSNGQQVMNKSIQHAGGSVSVTIERPAAIQPGVYILQVTGENENRNMKLIFK